MKRVLIVSIVSVMLTLLSCTKERISGNGPVVTESRNISNFSSVSVAGSTNVFITQGAAFKVEIKGYSNLLPYFETRLLNNTLHLGFKQNVNIKNDNTEVYITLPALNGLSLSGSGNIRTSGSFTGNTDFSMQIAGSGNIHFSNGTTQNFYSSIEGSGNIYALNMVSDRAETTTSGSGNTEITVNNQLKAKITGSGNVYYLGTPSITVNISGSGAVSPK